MATKQIETVAADVLASSTVTPARSTKTTKATTPGPCASAWLQCFQTLKDPQLIRMKEAALKFCQELAEGGEPRWLSLLGSCGAGKTMLAAFIRRFVVEAGSHFEVNGATGEPVAQRRTATWAPWRRVTRAMAHGDFSWVESLCDRGEDWFAVIDDIGVSEEKQRWYAIKALDDIADARLGMWTVWTCNKSLAQIRSELDTRIASRMLRGGNVVVEVNVPDWNTR